MLQHRFNKKAEDDVATAKTRGLLSPAFKVRLDKLVAATYWPEDYGLDTAGVTDAQAIQAALNAANTAGGGTVVLPVRVYSLGGATLNLDGMTHVTVLGLGSPTQAGGGAELSYSGTAGPIVKAGSSFGVRFLSLTLHATNAGFTGDLLTINNSIIYDPSYWLVDTCFFIGPAAARSGLNLNNSIIGTVRECFFTGTNVGILGRLAAGNYANAIAVLHCTFYLLVTAGIKNLGESWYIGDACTFEQLSNNKVGAVTQDAGVRALATVFTGNYINDATVAGGVAFLWCGSGLQFTGNEVSGSTVVVGDTLVKIAGTLASDGLVFLGNVFLSAQWCFNFNAQAHSGVLAAGNSIFTTTPYVNEAALLHTWLVANTGATDRIYTDTIGAVLEQLRTTDLAVAATTVTALATVTLTEGTWDVWAWANILAGAGAANVSLYLSVGTGEVALYLAASGQGSQHVPPRRIVVAPGATQVVNFNCYATAAVTAKWTGGPAGLPGGVAIRAERRL